MAEQSKVNQTLLRLSAYCGFAAPIVFIVALIIFGWLHPDYSHVSDLVSVLSAREAPYEVYMNWLGIIPFGTLILLFSFSYVSAHLPGFAGWASAACFTIVGFLFILAGLYVCDPGCDLTDPTPEAVIHNLTALGAFVFATTGAILISTRVRLKDDKRRGYYIRALICALGMMGGLIGLGIVGEHGALVGLVQRIFLGFVWAFLIISAMNILQWQNEK